MESNQLLSNMRQSKTVRLAMLCVVMAGLVMSPRLAGNEVNNNLQHRLKKVSIAVEDARPVAKAIETLEARYGWVITYEDPRYAYADDIVDVTEKVRTDLLKHPEGQAPKVFIPKGGHLSFEYDVIADTNLPTSSEVVVRQLLNAQVASPNSARFRFEKSNAIIHVIPSRIKDRSGKLTPQQSLLDTVVSLPADERTGLRTLEALTETIGKATQTRIVVGNVPSNLFLRHKDRDGVAGQKAREVLTELLQRISPGRPLSWQLLYDPGMKIYFMNIHAL